MWSHCLSVCLSPASSFPSAALCAPLAPPPPDYGIAELGGHESANCHLQHTRHLWNRVTSAAAVAAASLTPPQDGGNAAAAAAGSLFWPQQQEVRPPPQQQQQQPLLGHIAPFATPSPLSSAGSIDESEARAHLNAAAAAVPTATKGFSDEDDPGSSMVRTRGGSELYFNLTKSACALRTAFVLKGMEDLLSSNTSSIISSIDVCKL